MADRLVTVFGGSGFLGRRIVRHLLAHGLAARIAARRPDLADPIEASALPSMRADINNASMVAGAVAGAYAVVNAVSLYVERGAESFHGVHVQAAERVARLARQAGVERLVHVSGIGADATSRSRYIRSRGEGELAVRSAFANAIIIRPAVMFGRNDAFLSTLIKLLGRLPACPLFGQGHTRLQPVCVEDVGEAIARSLQPTAQNPLTYELGGPRVYTYAELVRTIADRLGKRPLFIPVPFAMWHLLAGIGEMLPGKPLSRNQVELMEVDTVASAQMPGFDALSIAPKPLEQALEQILAGEEERPS